MRQHQEWNTSGQEAYQANGCNDIGFGVQKPSPKFLKHLVNEVIL